MWKKIPNWIHTDWNVANNKMIEIALSWNFILKFIFQQVEGSYYKISRIFPSMKLFLVMSSAY